MTLVDDNTRKAIESFENDIKKILTKIILRKLRSIETSIDAECSSQAEENMANLICIQWEFADICTSGSITTKSNEVKKKLDDLVETVRNRYESLAIEDNLYHSPKDLFKKLDLASLHGGVKYNEIRKCVLQKISQNFTEAKDKLSEIPCHECPARLRSLNYMLCFLPDELQVPFKSQLDDMSHIFTDEEKMRNPDLHAR